MVLERFANNYSTALDGAIDNSQTTFDVLSVTGAPSPKYRIKIENELLVVTSVSSLTLTVQRGAEGTTAASHADGTLVTHIVTAASLVQGIRNYASIADQPPTTAGTYDEEFEGTADTLPSNWAWTSAPSGSDAWFLNSRWPSMLTVEGTGNTNYTLTRTSFTAASTFGIWAKLHAGPFIAADATDIRLYVSNSGETEQRGIDFRSITTNATIGFRPLRIIASAETVWGAEVPVPTAFTNHVYMGITRDGSNNFTPWMSNDGISWHRAAAAQSHTITIDRIRMLFRTTTIQSLVGVDWIRYRTDNAFPRP